MSKGRGRKRKKLAPVAVQSQFSLIAKLAELHITDREQEVVLGVIQGLSSRQIASQLCICEQTVKDHLQAVFQKSGTHRRSELIAKLLGFSTGEM